MEFFEIIQKNRELITRSAKTALLTAFNNVWLRAIAIDAKPQEPDFVARIIMDSVPSLTSGWKDLFMKNGIAFSLAGVYCHQSPKVHFPEMTENSCELGDLLLAHFHIAGDGHIYRNALLLQAKAFPNQPHRLQRSEGDQLMLYERWPDFEYIGSGSLSGEHRDVRPKMPHSGAQYMRIDNRFPGDPNAGFIGFNETYPVGLCMPSRCLYDYAPLSSELFRFLLHANGRTFDSKDHTEDGWTAVVWDLLRVSLRKTFKRRSSGYPQEPRFPGWSPEELEGYSYTRASASWAFSVASNIIGRRYAQDIYGIGGDQPPRNEKPHQNEFDSGPGVSTILIETHGPEGKYRGHDIE